jgi:DNA-binding transcriptional MerR regulator
MLTIGEPASYAGVTVRAVRHYHAKGLLPEPERDHGGYRRYGAAAVVELIKIRTLAEAGVPLARVRELLQADEKEFAAVVADIDKRLRAQIEQRQRQRQRIARLAGGHRRTWTSNRHPSAGMNRRRGAARRPPVYDAVSRASPARAASSTWSTRGMRSSAAWASSVMYSSRRPPTTV